MEQEKEVVKVVQKLLWSHLESLEEAVVALLCSEELDACDLYLGKSSEGAVGQEPDLGWEEEAMSCEPLKREVEHQT